MIEMNHAPLYSLVQDDDFLRIRQVTFTGSTKPTVTYPSLHEICLRWKMLYQNHSINCNHKQSCFHFFTWFLILAAGETEQRIACRRITDKHSRNITYRIKTERNYLKESLETAIRQEIYREAGGEKLNQDILKKLLKVRLQMIFTKQKDIEEVIRQAIAAAMTELGFPAVNPVEYSYKITNELIAQATSQSCRQYLEALKPQVAIYQHELETISQELKKYKETDNVRELVTIQHSVE